MRRALAGVVAAVAATSVLSVAIPPADAARPVRTRQLTDLADVGVGREIAIVGSSIIFPAGNPATGEELWRADLTGRNAAMLKEIRPGSKGSMPKDLTVIGAVVLFTAFHDDYGYELWRSDGTAAGTALVEDVNPGAASGYGFQRTVVGDTLYFPGNDRAHGVELWKSEPPYDAEHTSIVKDIRAGSDSTSPGWMTAVGATLFFSASDGAVNGVGVELWKSDGTAAGTVVVEDINAAPGGLLTSPGGSNPSHLAAVATSLFFNANDGVTGRELWRSTPPYDATSTSLVRDITPGDGESHPQDITAAGNLAYFNTEEGNGNRLYVSDGTDAGTEPVEGAGLPAHYWFDFTAIGSTLYFHNYDAQLWRTDGTSAGTVMVAALHRPSGGAGLQELTAIGGRLFFSVDDEAHGRELWSSDGTAAGTALVKDITPGAESSDPIALTAYGSTLVFAAGQNSLGRDIWEARSS